jgi:hypothetical protein
LSEASLYIQYTCSQQEESESDRNRAMQRAWEGGIGAHKGEDVDGEQDEDEERDAVQDAGAGGRRRVAWSDAAGWVPALFSSSTPSKTPGRSGLLRRKSNTNPTHILFFLSMWLYFSG